MPVYHVEVETLSPTLIGRGRVFRRVITETETYIPGQAIAGSIGMLIFKNSCSKDRCMPGCPDKDKCRYYSVFRDFEPSPTLFPGPLTPVCEKCGSQTIPMPVYISKCKKCSKLSSFYEEYLTPYDADFKCKAKLEEETCGFPHTEPASGYICPECGGRTMVTVRRITCTKIDGETMTAEEGNLFSKDYVARGSRFKGYMAVTGEDPFTVLRELGVAEWKDGSYVLEARIGGGKSRGFGRILVKASPIDIWKYIEKEVEKTSLIKNEAVGTVLTPLFSLEMEDGTWFSRVKPTGEWIARGAEEAYELLTGRKESFKGKLDVKAIYGWETHVSGWSLRTRMRRPVITALKPGSAVHISLEDGSRENIEMLSCLSLVGLSRPKKYAGHGFGLLTFRRVET